MKAVEDISSKLENSESEELWGRIDTHMLPAHSESTKKLNNCLERLYGLDLKPDFDALENIVNNRAPASINELNETYGRLLKQRRLLKSFSLIIMKENRRLEKLRRFLQPVICSTVH